MQFGLVKRIRIHPADNVKGDAVLFARYVTQRIVPLSFEIRQCELWASVLLLGSIRPPPTVSEIHLSSFRARRSKNAEFHLFTVSLYKFCPILPLLIIRAPLSPSSYLEYPSKLLHIHSPRLIVQFLNDHLLSYYSIPRARNGLYLLPTHDDLPPHPIPASGKNIMVVFRLCHAHRDFYLPSESESFLNVQAR